MSIRARVLGAILAGGLGLVASPASAGSPFVQVPPAEVLEASPAYRYANMTDDEALRELDRRGIAYERLDRVPGVRAPVRLASKLHGVLIRSSLPPEERIDSPFEILDARLALTLDDFTALLEAHDVVELVHYTMYRPNVSPPGSSPSNAADDHEASPKAVPSKAVPSKAVPSKGAAVRESAAKGKDGALEKADVEAKPAVEPKSTSGAKPEKVAKAEKVEKVEKVEKTAKVEKTRKKGKKKKGEGKDGARSAAKIKGAKEKDHDGRVAKATRSTKASPKDSAKTGEGAGKSAPVAVAANERREASSPETAPRAVEPEVALSKGVAAAGTVASSGTEPSASEGTSTDASSKATREEKPRKRRARHDKAVKGRRAAREAQPDKAEKMDAKGDKVEKTEKSDAKGDKAEKTEKSDAKGDKAEKTEKSDAKGDKVDAKGDKAEKTSDASARSWAPPGTRHPAGLAIDVGALRKSDGKWLHVADHFGGAIGAPTCGDRATPPSSTEGRELWSIVCESRDAGLFSYVLTPNYNAAHADHFHMEIKPGSRLVLYH